MVKSLQDGYDSLLKEVYANLQGESEKRQEVIPLVALKEYHRFMRRDQRLAHCFLDSGLNYNTELDKAYMRAFNSKILGESAEVDKKEII